MVRLVAVLDVFDMFEIPLDQWVSAAVDWITQYRFFFKDILAWPVRQLLTGIQDSLLFVPPIVLVVILTALAFWAAGRGVGIFTFLAQLAVGFLGLWDDFLITLSMVISAVAFNFVVGVPLGILAARKDGFAASIRPILDIMQTTPAFVYLVPVVILFSIGNVPGVIVTIVFSLPPMIRLTNLGIRQVDKEVIEAAVAFGSAPRDILTKVQIPLALPTIMAGLNQTIMLALSMVVIASLIGARGLGQQVFIGINTVNVGLATLGGVGIVLMAMILDRVTQGLAEKGPGAHQSS